MGRKGNTQLISSDWMLQLPCEAEARTFVNERSRDLFVRLHRKRCRTCQHANRNPAPDRTAVIDNTDGYRQVKSLKQFDSTHQLADQPPCESLPPPQS